MVAVCKDVKHAVFVVVSNVYYRPGCFKLNKMLKMIFQNWSKYEEVWIILTRALLNMPMIPNET